MCRMNCNLWRAIRMRYVKSMISYCRAWGWKYFWRDTFGSKPRHPAPKETP